jgi:hypothetical protein
VVVLISDALETLMDFAVETSSEDGFYPEIATLVRNLDNSSSTVRLRLAKARDSRYFNSGQLEQTIERNVANYAVFPPGVKLEIGDRLTITSTSDLLNQVFEVVEPLEPDIALGYRCGLAFVKGSR